MVNVLQERKVNAADCEAGVGQIELNWYPQPFVSESESYWFMVELIPVTPNSAIGSITVTPQPSLMASGYVIWLEQNGKVIYREERAGKLTDGLKHVAKYLTKRGTCVSGFCVKPPK